MGYMHTWKWCEVLLEDGQTAAGTPMCPAEDTGSFGARAHLLPVAHSVDRIKIFWITLQCKILLLNNFASETNMIFLMKGI